MAFSNTLITLLFLLLANKVRSQTSFVFDSFSPNSNNLTYQGDAFLPSGSSFIRLTKMSTGGNPTSFSVGRVVYSPPVQLWEPGRQASFETTLSFLITAVNNNPGDGVTFFIVPVGSPIPTRSTGGSFGLFDLTTGVAPSVFAVEFDIFFESDNRQWDPPYRHIGIDINSRVSTNTTRFDDMVGQVVTARINYVPTSRTIIVVASAGAQTSTLSYVFDLKTILPQQVQVGISSATGGSAAVHDLYSWDFASALQRDDDDNNNNGDTYTKEYA